MARRAQGERLAAAVTGVCLLLPLLFSDAGAGTAGKISGRVVDGARQPLAGVNVAIPDARLGAATDKEGRYVILNVPAGTYQVRVGLIGYRATTITDVIVSADNTTALDVTLQVAPVEMGEVVVSAERPVVNVALTSTMASVNREQISRLPVQELADVVNLQAGVVDGHFRGGRKGEVQYQVDGVTVNNVYDNTSTLRLDRSLLEEVQVISGTFDAEYGQAMSGVVNAVLRRGTEQFRWDAEAMSGGFFYPGSDRHAGFKLRPSGVQNYQATLSGPALLPRTFFLVNGRHYRFDDWIYARRKFRPTDRQVISGGSYFLFPSGDHLSEPLAYTHEWSGIAKLTNRAMKSIEMNYQAILNVVDGRRMDYAWRLNPDGVSKQRTLSVTHGLDWTHTLSEKTYYALSVRQNYFDYKDRVARDLDDSLYADGGVPATVPEYGSNINVVVQGVQNTRFQQNTNAFVVKGSFVNQLTVDNQIKLGGELQWPVVKFGNMGHLIPMSVNSGRAYEYVAINDSIPWYPNARTYHPRLGAAFAQEDLEWNDLRLRVGLRFEYFDARSVLPSDLRNPANAYKLPVPQSDTVATTPKYSVSPRIGVSYPITKDAALFFAYGHFYQLPPLGKAFDNADYAVLATLQAVAPSYDVMGNPDIKPERTVQYQFGYKQAVTDWLGLEANAFYKDIRDLLGVEIITTYRDADYARWTNVDFGSVIGLTVALDQRPRGLISTSMDYTWQIARGNASDPNETATRAEAGADPRPRQQPFDWDQRHTFNLTVSLARPGDFNVSAIARVASGQPYTPTVVVGSGRKSGPETNSGRKPLCATVDLRAEKPLKLGSVNASLFGRGFNLLDTRFFNGAVFGSTGSPYYSLDSATDRAALRDPTRYYGPRRVEVGITLGAGQ